MRLLRAVLLLLALAPATALAAEPSLVTRELPLGAARTTAGVASPHFNLVGLHWQGGGSVEFRTRSIGGRWSAWRAAAPEAEDRPDATSPEAAASRRWRIGNPYWTGSSDRIQYRTRGRVRRLRAHFVWSPVERVPVRTVSIANSPQIFTRFAWRANEGIRRSRPLYAGALRHALVHHTAGSNAYGPAQSAAIVRAIQLYHVRGNGWNDVGYNFLVDKYGQVFEGRYGGITRNVIGAHAEGFNTGSVGVAVLGTYSSSGIPAKAFASLANLLAWRLDVAHVHPASTLTAISAGNPRFPAGVPVFLRTISGHRDTGFTSCPGNVLYRQINPLAPRVAATGLPKLYSPRVRGSIGGRIRFTARLSTALPWTVTVRDGAGRTVAAGTGYGLAVDWTWDSAGVPRRAYTYSIDAGATVRPATGAVGGTPSRAPPVPLLSGVSVTPATLTPTDDGADPVGDYATVSYRLGEAALVTATFLDAAGTVIGTLFSEPKPAGEQSFRFSAAGLADGRYRIVIAAETASGKRATASVTVVVSRVLRSFTVTPALFSPNGDGRVDRVTFAVALASRARVTVRVSRGGTTAATPFVGDLRPGAHRLRWDGRNGTAPVPDGGYQASVTVASTPPVSLLTPLTLDTTPPRIRLVSLRPLRFWLSERATVVLAAGGRRAAQLLPAGVSTFPYSGALRPLRAFARDPAGNASRLVRVS